MIQPALCRCRGLLPTHSFPRASILLQLQSCIRPAGPRHGRSSMSAAAHAPVAHAHQPGSAADVGTSKSATTTDERSAKQQLRQQIKRELKALTSDSMHHQSAAIAQHVLQCRFFRDAASVGLYITCERLREVDTMTLLRQALQSGKQVFVPLVQDQASNMALLHIDSLDDLQPAPPFGILEPSCQHPDGSSRAEVLQAPQQLDLLLMPGLGFDGSGARLGRGGGYYDKLVHRLDDRARQQQWHRPWLVALAFREQLLAPGALPMDAHDRHVDVIATAQGLLLCSDRAKAHLAAAADAR